MTNLLLCEIENNGDLNISKLQETLTRIYGPVQLKETNKYSDQKDERFEFYLKKGSDNYNRVQNGIEIIMYPWEFIKHINLINTPNTNYIKHKIYGDNLLSSFNYWNSNNCICLFTGGNYQKW